MPPSLPLQYHCLSPDTDRKPIRLLELLPSSTSATPKCRLIHVFLTDNPPYEALSYCWGDEANPATIQFETGTISVRQNLYAALLRLRKKQETRTLWVDAICINQHNDSERTQQVRQMKDIYQAASRTLVWLGPGTDQTRKGFELVPYLLGAHLAFDENQPMIYSPLLERRLTHPNFGALQNRRDLYPAFQQLDGLPYFSRMWIIQELVVSGKNTQFLCGSDEFSQNIFIFAFATFYRLSLGKGTASRPWGSFLEMMQTSAEFARKEFHSLLFLLEAYREMKSTDSRDKVFALLGMADPKDVDSLGIEVNYELDVITLYTHLAKAFIQRDKNFNIFQNLGVASNMKELPTWVPDWTIGGEIPQPLGYKREANFCAGGRMSISVTFTSDSKKLIADGTIIDTVSNIGVVVGPEQRGKIYQDWEAVAGKVHSEKYVSGGSMIDAFINAILTGPPLGIFSIVKRQFLSLYRKAKTEFPAAFSQSSGMIQMEAQRQSLLGEDGDISTTQDDEMEQLFKCIRFTIGRRFCVTNQE